MDSLRARLLPGTQAAGFPFWSPDGRYIGFFCGRQAQKIDIPRRPAFPLFATRRMGAVALGTSRAILFLPQRSTLPSTAYPLPVAPSRSSPGRILPRMKPLTAGPRSCPTDATLFFGGKHVHAQRKRHQLHHDGSLDSQETKLFSYSLPGRVHLRTYALPATVLPDGPAFRHPNVSSSPETPSPSPKLCLRTPVLPTLGSLLPQTDCFSMLRVQPRIASWFGSIALENKSEWFPVMTLTRASASRGDATKLVYYLDGTGF